MTEEYITPGDDQTREMYARYGLAMYFAQVAEAGIKSALVMAQLESEQFATMNDFDDSWEKNFKATMGKLIHRLGPYLDDDSELEEDLRLALAMRNQLAHHFFWDHAADAMTSAGLDRMTTECMAAVEFFQELEARLSAVVQRYSENAGTSPDVFETRVEESMIRLLSDSEEIGARNCGRCLTPMEVVGSERRPYWSCPSCGAIALS